MTQQLRCRLLTTASYPSPVDNPIVVSDRSAFSRCDPVSVFSKSVEWPYGLLMHSPLLPCPYNVYGVMVILN